jgi:cell wall-associated NlpC family hydrolase
MKNIAIILLLLHCLTSCKSSREIVVKKSEPILNSEIEVKEPNSKIEENEISTPKTPTEITNSKSDVIIDYAKQFDGVRYKYGGTTKNGMDCSGLVSTVFKSEGILLPRSSKDMAAIGDWIDVKEVEKGDLLFFATRKNSRDINHVGLVTDVRPGFVEFIHSTINAGVIISNLAERYWYFAFVQARRILQL